MIILNNTEIRALIMKHSLRYWKIAQEIGISPFTLSVWLRTPLTGKRKERVEKAINELIG